MRKYYWTRDYTKHKFLLPVLLLLFFTGGAWAQCSLADYAVNVDKDESSCNQSSINVSVGVNGNYDDAFLDCYWKVSVVDKSTDKTVRSANFDETGAAGALEKLPQGTYYLKFEDESGENTYYWDGAGGFTKASGNKGELKIHDDYVPPIIDASSSVVPSCIGLDEDSEVTLKITNKEAEGEGFEFKIHGSGIPSQSSGKTTDTEWTFSGIDSGKEVLYSITDYSCGETVNTTGRLTLPESPQVAKAEKIRFYFKRDCENEGYTMQVGVYHDSKILDDQDPGELELTIGGETIMLGSDDLIEKQHSWEYRYEVPYSKSPKPGDIVSAIYTQDCLDKPLKRENYKLENFNEEVLYNASGYQENSNCNIPPQLLLNGTYSPNTTTYYDMVCEETDIKVYQEDPPESENYVELGYLSNNLEGVDFIGGDSKRPWPENDFRTDRIIQLTDEQGEALDIPEGGNFKVDIIKDGYYDETREIKVPKLINAKDQLRSLSAGPTPSLLKDTGGFSIKLEFEDEEGRSVYPNVQVKVQPSTPTSITSDKCNKKGADRYECTYEGPPGLEGKYTYDFPIEFKDKPDQESKDIKISDLPEGTYDIIITDPCSGDLIGKLENKKIEKKNLAQYDCSKGDEDSNYSCVNIIRKCSGVDVEYDLHPNQWMTSGGITHRFKDNKNRGSVTKNSMRGTYKNAPSSGNYPLTMGGAGRGFHSAINTEDNREDWDNNTKFAQYMRTIEIPVDIAPPTQIDPSVTYFCYITDTDEKRGQIEVDINRGTILYPLYYELLDEDGDLMLDNNGDPMNHTIEEGDSLNYPFKDLEAHTVIDQEHDPIPKVYKVRIINDYNGETGSGCSSKTYDITNFNCPEIADIEITKTGTPDRKFVDQKDDRDIEFVITVTNFGPERSTFNYVRDLLPEGYEPDEENPPVPSKGNYFTSGEDRGVWDIGSLEVDESVELVLKGEILRDKADGDYLNKATFTSKSRPRHDSPYDRKAEAEIERLYHLFRVNPALMNRTPEPEN